MMPITEKKRQWLWFVGLWSAGLAVVFLLAFATRFFLSAG